MHGTSVPTIRGTYTSGRFCDLMHRQCDALLRELYVDRLIADDLDAYLELAARLGKAPALRQALRTKILAGMQASPRFLDSQAYGRHVEGILLDIAAERLGIIPVENTEPCA